jgi:hypothetical protein
LHNVSPLVEKSYQKCIFVYYFVEIFVFYII